MKTNRPVKSILPKFKTPEHELLARIVFQAFDDVDTLARMPNDKAFDERRNDLWGFFTSPWLDEIADFIDMNMDSPIWDETRQKIWKCTKRRQNVQKPTKQNKSV